MIDPDLDFGGLCLILDQEIRNAWNLCERRANLISLILHSLKILTIHKDSDLRPNSRHHMINAMRDRLADIDVHALQGFEFGSEFCEKFCARCPGFLRIDIHLDLGEMRATRVLITFSAGVAQLSDSESATDAIVRADQAMYLAKRSGKNRVMAA